MVYIATTAQQKNSSTGAVAAHGVSNEGKVRGGNSFFGFLGLGRKGHGARDHVVTDVIASDAVSSGVVLEEKLKRRSCGSTGSHGENKDCQDDDGPLDFGYHKNLDGRFLVRGEIARGGNGVVRLVVDKKTGQEWAMKSIPKVLGDGISDGKNISERKRMDHADAIRREVEVMKRLRGFLNVASLEDVYEDDDTVHIVMERCTGGELVHRIGEAHYSEQTVASFLRATLRTLAQCHSNGILHRDIKPGNFLLASEKDDAPLKAIDFGLAVFMDDMDLPRTDLGLEGTPWYMAPETLQSEVYPESDVWAAGIMAYQLLTGKFPYNDKSNPYNPSLSKVWKSILMDDLNMSESRWQGISEEARDFVRMLLNKDPKKRPSARDALNHPWLKGTIKDRHTGTPLSLGVVQRIQRFSQASVFKRTVLELIAEELVASGHEESVHDQSQVVCPLNEGTRALITHPDASPLEYLYERLKMVDKSIIDRKELGKGLTEMGYKLSDDELERLLDQLDANHTGQIKKMQFAASQIDWKALQRSNTEKWIDHARKVFADLDVDGDGVLNCEEMTNLLRRKLPPSEVEGALRHAIAEASSRRKNEQVSPTTPPMNVTDHSLRDGLNFRQFLRLLSPKSMDSLDMFEERFGSPNHDASIHGSMHSKSSFDEVDRLLEKSIHGAKRYFQ